jgi:hypothetical protein
MKKITVKPIALLLLCSCMGVLANKAHAQKLVFVFGHGAYNNPADAQLNNAYKAGIGAEAGLGIGWKKTFIVGTVGYNSFGAAGNNSAGALTVVPFKAGIRQYIIGKLVYLHGDMGIANIKNKYTDATQKFTADAGAGVKLGPLEIQMDYEGFTRSNPGGFASWVGIKAGLAIGL